TAAPAGAPVPTIASPARAPRRRTWASTACRRRKTSAPIAAFSIARSWIRIRRTAALAGESAPSATAVGRALVFRDRRLQRETALLAGAVGITGAGAVGRVRPFALQLPLADGGRRGHAAVRVGRRGGDAEGDQAVERPGALVTIFVSARVVPTA